MRRFARDAALGSWGVSIVIAVASLLVPTVSTTAQETRVTWPSESEELALDTCDVDSGAASLDQDGTYTFHELLLVGDGFSLHSVGRGTIVIRGRSITVEEG